MTTGLVDTHIDQVICQPTLVIDFTGHLPTYFSDRLDLKWQSHWIADSRSRAPGHSTMLLTLTMQGWHSDMGWNKRMPDCLTRAVSASGKQTLLVVGSPGKSQSWFIFVDFDSFSHSFHFFLSFRTVSLSEVSSFKAMILNICVMHLIRLEKNEIVHDCCL